MDTVQSLTSADKSVDHVAVALAAYDAQETFRNLPAPTNLDEAKAAWSAVLKWYTAIYESGAPEPAKREADNARMAARKVLLKFQEEATQKRLAGYDMDDLKALHPTVIDIVLDAAPNMLFLPNDYLPAHLAAARMFGAFARTGEMYRRGAAVVEVRKHGMEVLSSTGFRSRLSKHGRKVVAIKKTQTEPPEYFASPKNCGEDTAKLLLGTTEVSLLPEIKLVTRAPVLIERDGALVATQPGYNADCGVLVLGNKPIPEVSVEAGVAALVDLLRDFKFNEDGDKARALAAIVGPAIRMGGLLSGDALMTEVEADQSQAGKGYFLKILRAIYSEPGYLVQQKEGGVGSLDESLGAALISGAPFVNFDNLRGRMRSAYLESIITAGKDHVPVRVPHRGELQVDISAVSFQLTSNGFHSTVDLSNRLMVVRLLKQPSSHAFATWREGSLLQRVEHWAHYYLGCVHAIVRHWHAAGKPRLPTAHTFKEWVGSLDWIVQSVFKTHPLLEGHAAAAARIASPSLSWLRQIALLVIAEGRGGQELRASDIRDIAERRGALPEGVRPGAHENETERAIGRVMAACFADSNTLTLDGITVNRIEREERDSTRSLAMRRYYTFVSG